MFDLLNIGDKVRAANGKKNELQRSKGHANLRNMIKTSPKEAQAIIEACKETILISLRAFDETAAVRVLVYSNHFIDLP